jgi:hypothetical protein
MSLGIVFKGPEGIVLAADSRVTLGVVIQDPQGRQMQIPATYDNATKLLRITGHEYVGAVTYGLGAIGEQEPRTAHSFMPEFEQDLAKAGNPRLTVKEFAQRLSDFFMGQWKNSMPSDYQGPDMVFLVAGYNQDEAYGRVFQIGIPRTPAPKEEQANPGQFGIVWGGQRQFTDRLIQGFDDSVPEITQQVLSLNDAQRDSLRDALRGTLQARIPYQFLPLQDCVDLSIFLIRTTITVQNWVADVRGVGGSIDVATITRTGGFKDIQIKRVIGETSEPGGLTGGRQ